MVRQGGPGATHRVAHRAGVARDLVHHTTIAILVLVVDRSLEPAEDPVRRPDPALATVTLAITAQMGHVLNVDAPVHLQVLAQVQILGTMILETTCTPRAKNLEVLAPTTAAHVVIAGARAVAGEMALMISMASTPHLKAQIAEVDREGRSKSGLQMSR